MSKNFRKAMMLGLMGSFFGDETPRGSFEDSPKVNGNPNNPEKECPVCGNTHHRHSKFCGDICTLEYIKEKREKQ